MFFFVVLAQIIYSASWGVQVTDAPIEPTTRGIGAGLVQAYLLPFEFSAVTLLVCLVGAAYMARRGTR